MDASKLKISSIYLAENKSELSYELSEPVAEYGSKLTIQLPEESSSKHVDFWFQCCDVIFLYFLIFRCVIGINYETSPDASGLQWLSSKATAGKKYPFLFSQFQVSLLRFLVQYFIYSIYLLVIYFGHENGNSKYNMCSCWYVKKNSYFILSGMVLIL